MKNKNKSFRADAIGSYFRLEWLPLLFVTLSGLVYNVGLLAGPWYEGRLAQCLADILGGNASAANMAALVLGYILVTLLVQAARFIKRFYVRRFANNINRRMKGILYANLVRQSRASLEKEGAGELMTKAISDVDDCVEGMRKFTTEVFDTGVALAGHVVMLLVYDWRLALLSLLFTPFSYVCAAWMKKPVQRAGAAYKKAAGALSAATLDRAQNAVTYRIYGCEDARAERYEEVLDTYEKTAVKNNVWQSALPPLYLAVSEAGVLFILWFGAKNVLGTGWRVWDIAAFTTFLSCFTKLVVKSSKVAKLFNSVQKAEVSWKRIKPLMKQPEQLEPLQVPQAADVTLKDLAFAYGDVPIFSGLNLTAHPGDIIGIPNHGQLRIGDCLTEGEKLHFTGIPSFAPELLKSVRALDPLKSKHLGNALRQIAEEGGASVFKPVIGAEWIVGVVGVLQFEVMADRIRTEFGIPVAFEPTQYFTARWLEADDKDELKKFADANRASMATDHDGAEVFLARNAWHLNKAQEDFPKVRLNKTREQIF